MTHVRCVVVLALALLPAGALAQVQWLDAVREVTGVIHAYGDCDFGSCPEYAFEEWHSDSAAAPDLAPWTGRLVLDAFPESTCPFCDAHAAVTQDSSIGPARVDLTASLAVGGAGFYGAPPNPFVARGGGHADSLAQVTFSVEAPTAYRLAGEFRAGLTIAGGDPYARYWVVLWEGPLAQLPAPSVELLEGACPWSCPPEAFERMGTLAPGVYTLELFVDARAEAVPAPDFDPGTVALEAGLDAVLELEVPDPPAPAPALPAPWAAALAAMLLAVAARSRSG